MNMKTIATGLVSAAVIAAAAYWMTLGDQAPGPALAQETTTQEDGTPIDTSGIIEMTMGPSDAKVTIVEYASYTCPHCANFHKNQFKNLKAEFIDTNQVHFVYRDVYFDRFGLWASIVARCGGPERFFGISDMLYMQQREWLASGNDPMQVVNNLRTIGKVAGLDDETLDACLEDNAKAQALAVWFQENVGRDDISSTPTLLINGKKYSNMSYDDLKKIILEELGS
jgi:protein-disulfide isomerase